MVVIALKLFYPFVLRFDSDEPQHLHVVWGWATGLLQYRDVFDNHSPLFQILCAPLCRALGERADIVIPMRFAMIPLFAVTLWCVYQIGAALYSRRAALWSTLATALVPVYFFTSSEFRTDDLWMAFWMLSLVFLVTNCAGRFWPFWAGFSMGCAFSTSMKTSLLLGSLAAGAICVGLIKRISRPKEAVTLKELEEQPKVSVPLGLLSGLLGLVLVPLAIVLFFYLKGAFREFYYCVIEHNVVPGMGNSKPGLHNLRLPIAMPFLLGIGFAIYKNSASASLGSRRALIFLTGGIYLMALRSYWPLITAQDYLPFVPLACIVAAPLVLWGVDRTQIGAIRVGIPVLAIIALLSMTIMAHPFWENDTKKQIAMIRDVLSLTQPNETIMDGKGETIFRKRCFYYVLEGITIERIRRGLIPNTIVQNMIDTETAVIHESRLQGDAIDFVRSNYLPIGNLHVLGLRVLGKMLNESKKDSDAVYRFSVAVPSEYQIVSKEGAVTASLDGTPLAGARRLEAGPHELRVAGPHGSIALFWARAVQKGYSPF